MIAPDDMAHCREAIRHGSLSFYAASHLLPSHVRDPALALYAFCRLADDEVDLKADKAASVLALERRLSQAYNGKPRDAAPDRAFAAIIERYDMPRALPEALLEGLAWDAMEKRYQTLSDLRGYAARVAGTVGVMMAVLMEVRDRNALARACDLGVAMQFTNIARDVGEDARENRLYLPLDWLHGAGLDPAAFLADPRPDATIRRLTKRLLAEARPLYDRAEAGIAELPIACRPGIFAARHIYAGIGGRVRAAGFDSVTQRARTGAAQKVGWLMLAATQTLSSAVMPRSARLYSAPLPEVSFLVDAAAQNTPDRGHWGAPLVTAMAALKARDQTLIEHRQRLR